MNFDDIIQKARETNRYRDKTEQEAGFASPDSSGAFLHLQTAMEAVKGGLRTGDWDCIAEGWVMLDNIANEVLWMEMLLMVTKITVGGCSTSESNLYDFGREMFQDVITYPYYKETIKDKKRWFFAEFYEGDK